MLVFPPLFLVRFGRCLVRCGAVRCGAVRCGVVWCGVVWCGVVWCGVAQRGVMGLIAQLRIHDSQDVDFYVLVASGPIIEDCSRLRFAPTGLGYPDYHQHLQVSESRKNRRD